MPPSGGTRPRGDAAPDAGGEPGQGADAGVGGFPSPADEPPLASSPEGPADLTPTDLDALGKALWRFLEGLEGSGGELAGWLAQDDVLLALLAAGAVGLASEVVRRRLRRLASDPGGAEGYSRSPHVPGPLYLARG